MQQARPAKHRQERSLQEKAAPCGGAKTGMCADTRAVNHRADSVLHHKESYDAAARRHKQLGCVEHPHKSAAQLCPKDLSPDILPSSSFPLPLTAAKNHTQSLLFVCHLLCNVFRRWKESTGQETRAVSLVTTSSLVTTARGQHKEDPVMQ